MATEMFSLHASNVRSNLLHVTTNITRSQAVARIADRTSYSGAYDTARRQSSVTYVLWLNGASYSKSYY